jgi:hypothetical protein
MTRVAPLLAWRVAAAAALLACSAGLVRADTLSPDAQLAAIRKGLVQAALDGATQVSTTQWIDSNGALQESSAFRNGMKVRGVRVLAYGADAQGEPLAQLQWQGADSSESTTKATNPKAAQCKTPMSGRLHHVLAWSWTNATPWAADTAPLLDALRASVLAQLQQAGTASAQWHLSERSRGEGRSSYQQALLGSSADELPWQLQFQLAAMPPQPAPTPVALPAARSDSPLAPTPPSEAAGLRVELRMTLTARKQTKPALQSSASLTLDSAQDNWGPSGLSSSARDQISQQVQAWSQALQSQLGCQMVMAEVTQAAGAQVRINVGSAAGVRVGDDWILANDQNAVQRPLEPGAVSQTVLAKVQSVGEHHAVVRATAGAMQNVKTSWTAWPAEAQR